jgi:hypothetical protein
VISRIVEPTSILDTGRVLTDLGQSPVNERTMRRTLGRAQQRDPLYKTRRTLHTGADLLTD